jgi:hypothetical protein
MAETGPPPATDHPQTAQQQEIITPSQLETTLKEKLDAPYVFVEDISGMLLTFWQVES